MPGTIRNDLPDCAEELNQTKQGNLISKLFKVNLKVRIEKDSGAAVY